MKDDDSKDPADDGKTPHERFIELGKKLMAASKSEIAAREKQRHATRLGAPKRRLK